MTVSSIRDWKLVSIVTGIIVLLLVVVLFLTYQVIQALHNWGMNQGDFLCNVLNASQLTSVRTESRRVNKITFVSAVVGNSLTPMRPTEDTATT